MSQAREARHYTSKDYFNWPDALRCELIHGEVYDMTPAPSIGHQRLVRKLGYAIENAIQQRKSERGGDGGCELLLSPVDVFLAEDTVVQPDLAVVCDPGKLENGKYVDGPPDLVVEVLSPSTALKDRREKRSLYEAAGVAEYLIVDPVESYTEYYRLDSQGRYDRSTIWGPGDELALTLLPELTTPLSELLGWPVPAVKESPMPYV
ncbi:MAG: Uma2 family endonuclease [Deltaproteobacteria bacterium]|nr:Uma2 family endonuclease [Deltaproteobacteria bacterium]